MARYTKQEQETAREYLLGSTKPSDQLYTVLRHVSASGMTRHISVLRVTDNNRIQCLDWYIARVADRRQAQDGSLIVGGCGMDMGFSVVYNLSSALFPDGYDCTKTEDTHCYSNDHFNGDKRKHHPAGGYALRQDWI